jgi:hypothetical protein
VENTYKTEDSQFQGHTGYDRWIYAVHDFNWGKRLRKKHGAVGSGFPAAHRRSGYSCFSFAGGSWYTPPKAEPDLDGAGQGRNHFHIATGLPDSRGDGEKRQAGVFRTGAVFSSKKMKKLPEQAPGYGTEFGRPQRP